MVHDAEQRGADLTTQGLIPIQYRRMDQFVLHHDVVLTGDQALGYAAA